MLKKELKEIKEQLNNLSLDIVEKARKYDEITSLLEEVKLCIDKPITYFDEKSMSYVVKISYKTLPITLYIDENGEAAPNPRFRAINMLNLISLDAMDEIVNAISRADKLNKGEG